MVERAVAREAKRGKVQEDLEPQELEAQAGALREAPLRGLVRQTPGMVFGLT